MPKGEKEGQTYDYKMMLVEYVRKARKYMNLKNE